MFEDFGGCKGYVYQNNVSTYVNMPLDGCVVRTLFTTTFKSFRGSSWNMGGVARFLGHTYGCT